MGNQCCSDENQHLNQEEINIIQDMIEDIIKEE